jgi:Ca2+-binding RTX toxin-like protein
MANRTGTPGDDTLYGTNESDNIAGLGGHDMLKGFGGADRLDGGAGIDAALYDDSKVGVAVNLTTGRGAGGTAAGDTLFNIENLFGSAFNDTLIGNDGSNELYGLGGNDVLKGGGGADGLDGGDGDDILTGGGDADFLDGGTGNDTADYSQAGFVYVDLLANLGFFGQAQGDTFSSIENVTGSAYDHDIVGSNVANVLRGGYGDDDLDGWGGPDTLIGGGGDDSLSGGSGFDSMIGGTGDDDYTVESFGDTIIEYANEGIDHVWTSIDYTLGANLEELNLYYGTGARNGTGNELNNYIGGNRFDNILDGRGGVDHMIGSEGNDTYIVDNANDLTAEVIGQGFDRVRTSVSYSLSSGEFSEIELLETTNQAGTAAIDLVGNQFNQTIVGNNGSNTIVGSPAGDDVNGDGVEDYDGLDVMTGGGAGDVFVWTSTNETRLAGQEADVVTDFNRAGGDLLAFNPIDANAMGGTANDVFTFVGIVDVTQGGSFAGVGQIGYFTTATDTFILLNTEVDAGVDFQDATIRVAGAHTVDASWFVL